MISENILLVSIMTVMFGSYLLFYRHCVPPTISELFIDNHKLTSFLIISVLIRSFLTYDTISVEYLHAIVDVIGVLFIFFWDTNDRESKLRRINISQNRLHMSVLVMYAFVKLYLAHGYVLISISAVSGYFFKCKNAHLDTIYKEEIVIMTFGTINSVVPYGEQPHTIRTVADSNKSCVHAAYDKHKWDNLLCIILEFIAVVTLFIS